MYPCSTVAPLESDPNPTKRNLAKDFEVEDTDTLMTAFIFLPLKVRNLTFGGGWWEKSYLWRIWKVQFYLWRNWRVKFFTEPKAGKKMF